MIVKLLIAGLALLTSTGALSIFKVQQIAFDWGRQRVLDEQRAEDAQLCQQGPGYPEPCDCWPWPENCC